MIAARRCARGGRVAPVGRSPRRRAACCRCKRAIQSPRCHALPRSRGASFSSWLSLRCCAGWLWPAAATPGLRTHRHPSQQLSSPPPLSVSCLAIRSRRRLGYRLCRSHRLPSPPSPSLRLSRLAGGSARSLKASWLALSSLSSMFRHWRSRPCSLAAAAISRPISVAPDLKPTRCSIVHRPCWTSSTLSRLLLRRRDRCSQGAAVR